MNNDWQIVKLNWRFIWYEKNSNSNRYYWRKSKLLQSILERVFNKLEYPLFFIQSRVIHHVKQPRKPRTLFNKELYKLPIINSIFPYGRYDYTKLHFFIRKHIYKDIIA